MRLTRWLVCKYLSQPTNASTSNAGIKTPLPPQIPWGGYNGFHGLESSRSVGKLSFTLPNKYKPGRDLMSKLILDDKRVNNIVVKEIIGMELTSFRVVLSNTPIYSSLSGQHAVNQCVSRPTEWIDLSGSDVVYSHICTLDCFDQILSIINDQQKPTTTALRNNTNDSGTKNWQFIEKYYNHHGAFNWETIFELGKTKGLFNSYSRWTSVKSAYYMQKKQKQ